MNKDPSIIFPTIHNYYKIQIISPDGKTSITNHCWMMRIHWCFNSKSKIKIKFKFKRLTSLKTTIILFLLRACYPINSPSPWFIIQILYSENNYIHKIIFRRLIIICWLNRMKKYRYLDNCWIRINPWTPHPYCKTIFKPQ